VDRERRLVTIESGCPIETADRELRKAGLAVPSSVVLTSVRYGGVVGTGSHGSGWECGTLSDFVEAMTIVTASGDVVRFTAATHGEDVMSAARLSLGLFGLVYDITLRVVPDFNLEVTDRREPLSLMRDPARLRDLVTSHYFCDVFWFPLSNALWVKTARKTDRPAVPYGKSSRLRDAFDARAGSPMLKAMVRTPRMTPMVNQTALTMQLPRPRTIVRDAVDAIHYKASLEAYFCQLTSFTVKLDDGFENATRSWCMAMDRALELAKQGRYPLTLMLQARFIGHSRALLSPAFGVPGEHHCYLEMLSVRGTEGCEAFFDDIATQWMAAEDFEARPHWGKYFHAIPGIVPYLHRRMGNQIRRFNAAREAIDPDGMFLSPYLEAILYPEGGASVRIAGWETTGRSASTGASSPSRSSPPSS
jgi:L-gulonolactone oxidase